jgi:hypothetical protein
MGQTDWRKILEERGDFEKEKIQNLTPENSNPEIACQHPLILKSWDMNEKLKFKFG